MAGKAKSVYLTVVPKGELHSVFKRMFFNAKEYNDFIKSEQFKEKYPDELFQVIKEVY
jgi:hypothetical protein